MKYRQLFPHGLIVIPAMLILTGCSNAPTVQIHYLGHASFLMRFDNGLTVLTDYGESRAWGLDSPIYDCGSKEPDIVTYSHDHADHQREITWEQATILTATDSLSLGGLTVTPIRTCELDLETPDNTSYLFTYKGLKILHLADAQVFIRSIAQQEVQERVRVLYPEKYDVLLMTIEGRTQFIPQAEAFIDLLQPKRVIPMHYWSAVYKASFLNYLVRQNRRSGKKYQIERIGSAEYALWESDGDMSGIQVISLDPAAPAP
ncbi:MAG: MBL fold metallo-hydrolase [Fidelibacterota bacterium]|nr:MAG: MBL fold metallo-hydrolase [Candidatus Neomarinimicrobiota bacterium]